MRRSHSLPIGLAIVFLLAVTPIFAAENGLGIVLVRIPAGKFLMGSPPGEQDRIDHENQHEVELTHEFLLAAHEVTIDQFRAFVQAAKYKTDAERDGQGGFGFNGITGRFEGRDPKYSWKNSGWATTDAHPVVNVSWNDAQAFCAWLSKQEGKRYRLPTEAEWEYACRASTTTAFHHGDDPEGIVRVANVADATAKEKLPFLKSSVAGSDGFVFTSPVGTFQKNALGLFDMHGNVWEWCQDFYHGKRYEEASQRDPSGPEMGTLRAFRSGSWDRPAGRCRSAARGGNAPEYRNLILGFRVAADP